MWPSRSRFIEYLMAGSASTNPMPFVVAVGLILAWKGAGRIGADNHQRPCRAPRGAARPRGAGNRLIG